VVQGTKGGEVFLGEYKHTMDSKGRIVIPSKFRKELQQGCVVTKGLDNCLQILTKKNWNQESEKMASLPSTDKTSRQLRRALFSGAVDSSLDSAGRIQIPENLRMYSSILVPVLLLKFGLLRPGKKFKVTQMMLLRILTK